MSAKGVGVEEHYNTETEEGTMALQKKRARRVSFAEMTSVHFFDRDEEYETLPDTRRTSKENPRLHSSGDSGFHQDFSSDGNDSKESSQNEEEGEDGDELDSRRSFLRPIESPSPGSTIGSATSNDEDNFFGPVSASFIRPGRLSDSAASDENHDVTMDSTAFSMHFCSLARSDSGGDLKTPTGVRLSFEEKTPMESSGLATLGSSMVLTTTKKPSLESFAPITKSIGGTDSNDMSLVEENLYRYDYARLSPRLDALLAESSKDLDAISASDNIRSSKSPRNKQNQLSPPKKHITAVLLAGDDGEKVAMNINTHDLPATVSVVHSTLGEENAGSRASPNFLRKDDSSTNTSDAPISFTTSRNQLTNDDGFAELHCKFPISGLSAEQQQILVDDGTPSIVTPSEKLVTSVVSKAKDGFEFRRPALDNNFQDDEFAQHESKSPSAKLISRLFAAQNQILVEDVTPSIVTPSGNLASSIARNEKVVYNSSASSIQKSISKLKKLESSPFSSTLNAKMNYMKLSSSDYIFRTPPFDTRMERNKQTSQEKRVDASVFYSKEKLLVASGRHQTSRECFVNSGSSATNADQLDSITKGRRVWHDSKMSGIGQSKNSTIADTMDDRETNFSVVQDEPDNTRNFKTFLRDRDSEILPSETRNRDLQAGAGLLKFNGFPARGIEAADEPPLQENLPHLHTYSLARAELYSTTPDNYMPASMRQYTPSPKFSQLISKLENSSARKRGNEEILPRDQNGEFSCTQRSPKLHKAGVHSPELIGQTGRASLTSCSDHEQKHWSDIYSKFYWDMKQLHCPSIDKLNLQAIDILEDILVHMHRSKTYGMLSAEIQSQQQIDRLSNPQHRRISEIRLSLHKILNAQAKLKLRQAKWERLQKMAQLMGSRIQKAQILKSNYLLQLSKPCATVENNHEVSSNRTTAMQHALESLKREIMNLTKSVQVAFKMKGEPNYAETIVLVTNHLMKRTCFRFVRLDIQSLVIDSLESRNGSHHLVLNYLGFIIQRLTVTVGPISRFTISNKKNDRNIMKSFPNLDACTAFAFVLNAETVRKYAGPRSLAQETQMTSLLLGNLLDVIEEVQLAQIELRNLIQIGFLSPSVEQLILELYFLDFKSCGKMVLTLDLSCLKWGVYPSETLPSHLAAPADDGTRRSLSQPLSDRIGAAIKSLRAGYMRVIGLCRCVSRVIQESSM